MTRRAHRVAAVRRAVGHRRVSVPGGSRWARRVRLACLGLAALTVVLAACSDTVTPSPAILTITIDPTPTVTRDLLVDVAGRVDRDPPAADLPLVVRLDVGTASQAIDTAGPDGRFALVASLLPDSANEIRLTASDPVGSVGHNGVLVRQDNTPPRVLSVTPLEFDLISPFTNIQLNFTEPVAFADTPFVALELADTRVSGIAVQSADGMRVSFLPDQALETNRPYTIRLGAYHDRAGRAGAPYARCFVTRPGAGAFSQVGGWTYQSVGSTEPVFVFNLRLQRNRDGLSAVLDLSPPDAAFGDIPDLTAFFDFDTDHDTTTGVVPARDSLLGAAWPSSGIRVDHGIVVTIDSEAGVVRAGPKTGPLSIAPAIENQAFWCTGAITFALPLSAIGAPDTTTAWVSAVYWIWPNGWLAAGLPDSGAVPGFSR